MKYTRKQYEKEIKRINAEYAKIEKKYIHTQAWSGMFQALQQEKNERLLTVTQKFYNQNNQK